MAGMITRSQSRKASTEAEGSQRALPPTAEQSQPEFVVTQANATVAVNRSEPLPTIDSDQPSNEARRGSPVTAMALEPRTDEVARTTPRQPIVSFYDNLPMNTAQTRFSSTPIPPPTSAHDSTSFAARSTENSYPETASARERVQQLRYTMGNFDMTALGQAYANPNALHFYQVPVAVLNDLPTGVTPPVVGATRPPVTTANGDQLWLSGHGRHNSLKGSQ